MRPASALQLISHTGHKQNFLEVYKKIDILIRRMTTKQQIFVMNSANHVFVLETFFDWNESKYSLGFYRRLSDDMLFRRCHPVGCD